MISFICECMCVCNIELSLISYEKDMSLEDSLVKAQLSSLQSHNSVTGFKHSKDLSDNITTAQLSGTLCSRHSDIKPLTPRSNL